MVLYNDLYHDSYGDYSNLVFEFPTEYWHSAEKRNFGQEWNYLMDTPDMWDAFSNTDSPLDSSI